MRQQGCGPAGAGADVKHIVARLGIKPLQHHPDSGRLADGLASADRQWHIGRGHIFHTVRHKIGPIELSKGVCNPVHEPILDQQVHGSLWGFCLHELGPQFGGAFKAIYVKLAEFS